MESHTYHYLITKKGDLMWNKEQYIKWTEERSQNPADWDIDDCKEADKHIRVIAVKNLMEILKDYKLPKYFKYWVYLMASFTMESVETDNLLIILRCYPDYMK
jgi:hypothetical protein